MVPLFSAVVWLAMLLALLLHWIVNDHRKIYPSEAAGQTIAYISDAGAYSLKPLFISMGAVSVVSFDLAFIGEQYLRTTGRLAKNNTAAQKILAWFSILFAVVGAAGLILLSIFDTYRHPTLHDVFLALFIGGYVVSAVFTCAEYQRLGALNRQYRILRGSFWIKLAFILIEIALAIAFGVLNKTKKWNNAAVVEWVIALVYAFYVASYALDFRPATRNHRHGMHHRDEVADDQVAMAQDRRASPGVLQHDDAFPRYASGPATGSQRESATDSSYSHGYANGTHKEGYRV
jgi:hypothetical protein